MCAKEAKMKKLQRKSVSERGSALIISLLVLMALTGLGAVAFTDQVLKFCVLRPQSRRNGAKLLRRQSRDGRLVGRRDQGEGVVAE
jgi:hypothetical protein